MPFVRFNLLLFEKQPCNASRKEAVLQADPVRSIRTPQSERLGLRLYQFVDKKDVAYSAYYAKLPYPTHHFRPASDQCSFCMSGQRPLEIE
jgi:hypothetical protein